MYQYKIGDEVAFTVLDINEDEFIGIKIGIINKINNTTKTPLSETDRCEIIVSDFDEIEIHNKMFKEIINVVRKAEYELGDYVILDFGDYGNISGMIDGIIETFDEKFYDVGIYINNGCLICPIGTFSNKDDDYQILWDSLRNEENYKG